MAPLPVSPRSRGNTVATSGRVPPLRGTPLPIQINAVLWYVPGVSMHRMALLLRVAAQAGRDWIKIGAK